jgi:hypothetical protein
MSLPLPLPLPLPFAFAFFCPPLHLWHTHLLVWLRQHMLAGVHLFAASLRLILLSSLS